jgi:hypothetical protein
MNSNGSAFGKLPCGGNHSWRAIEMWQGIAMMLFLVLLGLLMAWASHIAEAEKRRKVNAERERRWKQWEHL